VSSASQTTLSTGRLVLLLLAIGSLGAGVYVADWQPGPGAFGLTFLSYLLLLAAVIGRVPAALDRISRDHVVVVAAAIAIAFFVLLVLRVPSGLPPRRYLYFFLIALAAGLFVASVRRTESGARWPVRALLAIYVALGAWVIIENPTPPIDVWAWHQEALKALFAGRNPYAMDMPNIYGNGTYYAFHMLAGDRVLVGFQYPPLSLYLAVPGYLLGDYRFSLLAASAVAGATMAQGPNGRLGVASMVLWLFLPVAFLVMHLGWTDPFVVLFLALTVAAAARHSRWAFVPLGLLLGVKHYVVLAAPLLWLLSRHGDDRESWLRVLAKAAVVAIVLTLPFILWNPRALFDDLLKFQLDQPFRRDSLSALAWAAHRFGWMMPQWIGWAAAAPATWLALRYAPRSASGFAMAVGFVFFTFFAFSKQAFVNYYVFVMGALATAVAFAGSWPAHAHERDPSTELLRRPPA
jgi:hypothetical protein